MTEEDEYKEILQGMMRLCSHYIKSKTTQALKHAMQGDLQKAMSTTRESFAQLKSYASDIDNVARFIHDAPWRATYRSDFAQMIRGVDQKMADILRIGIALQMKTQTYADA